MSHLSKLKVQVKDEYLMNKVTSMMGWSVKRETEYINGWSREKVTNCQVLRDESGKVKMVIDVHGNVIHDSFYMGREAHHFLCEYSEQFIRAVASREGAMVKNLGFDNLGNRVLEVAYLY